MNILIADDHGLFRSGMRLAVQQFAEGGAEVHVVEAADWQAAILLLQQHPDLALALVDLNMPGMNVHHGLKNLLAAAETVPVVVVSSSDNLLDMKHALDAGAMGYVSKHEPIQLLIGALRLVLAGGVYVPPVLLQLSEKKNHKDSEALPFGLTPRQYDVLQALVTGKSNQQIADLLHLSEATIKAHLGAIYKTLRVSTRREAIQTVKAAGSQVAG